MSLKFYVDKFGKNVFVQSTQSFGVDAFGNVTFLFPSGDVRQASIASTQAIQSDALAAGTHVHAAIADLQVFQSPALGAATHVHSLVVSLQAAQADALASSTHVHASIDSQQATQSDALTAQVGAGAINASIDSLQATQSDALTVIAEAAAPPFVSYSRIDTQLEPKKQPEPLRLPKRQRKPARQSEPAVAAVASLEIWPATKAVAKYTRRVYDPYLDEKLLRRRQRDDVKRYWRVA